MLLFAFPPPHLSSHSDNLPSCVVVTMSDSGEDVLTSEQGAGPAVSARVAKLAQDIYDEFQNIIGTLQ